MRVTSSIAICFRTAIACKGFISKNSLLVLFLLGSNASWNAFSVSSTSFTIPAYTHAKGKATPLLYKSAGLEETDLLVFPIFTKPYIAGLVKTIAVPPKNLKIDLIKA